MKSLYKKRRFINRFYLFICFVALMAVSVYAYIQNYEDEKSLPNNIVIDFKDAQFAVVVSNGKNIEQINVYQEDDSFYIFLPTYADLENTYFCINNPIKIDGTYIENESSLKNVDIGRVYEIELDNGETGNITFLKSTNIGTIFIDTETGSIESLYADKDYKENANMRLYTATGTVQYNDDLEFISGRGNQTWGFDKRSWTIKTVRDVSLLGMKADSKWVLMANMAEDTDGLRNRVVYKFANYIELSYSSEMEFIDLYLNNEYFGTYQLVEKIEISDNRMNIGDLSKDNKKINGENYNDLCSEIIEVQNEDGSFYTYSPIESPSNITGGYVVERNYGTKWAGKSYRFTTTRGECFNVREPSVLSEEEMKYLLSIFQSAENAIYNDKFIDEDSGLKIDELIDLESWSLKYLVEEISKNSSGGSTSSYFYLKRNDNKIYAGPVWDYDKSLGTTGLYMNPIGATYLSWHGLNASYWWKKLYAYEPYKELVKKNYIEKAKSAINELVENDLDDWKEEIRDSYIMNYYRWRNSYGYLEVIHVPSILANQGDIDFSAKYLKEWLNSRMNFLDELWIDEIEYHNIIIMNEKGSITDVKFVIDGNSIDELNKYRDGYRWVEVNSGEIIDENTIVTKELTIKPEKINDGE